MPSASYSHRVPIEASPSVVWARLQEPDTWAQIGPIEKVWDPVVDGDGVLRSFSWSTHAAGRVHEGQAATSVATPNERMVVDLETTEVAGSLEVFIDEAALVVSMSLRPVGLLATVFFGPVSEAVGKGLGDHVETFASQFGTAEF